MRTIIRRAGPAILLGSALLSLGSCRSPTDPSPGVPILLLLTADGPFSVNFQGQTITAQGPYNFTLKPGTYEITGQMRTYVLSVDFSRVTGTGAFRRDPCGASPARPSTSPSAVRCISRTRRRPTCGCSSP